MQRAVRRLVCNLGGFAILASTPRSMRGCATWSTVTTATRAPGPQGALGTDLTVSSSRGYGRSSQGFAAFAARGATPPSSTHRHVRHVTKGVGVHVGADGDVDRAMRKLKRTMINEGIEKAMKAHQVFLKGSDARVVAKRERDHRKWRKALRSKLGWIVRRKDRGF
jgi:ribosomal protein S21